MASRETDDARSSAEDITSQSIQLREELAEMTRMLSRFESTIATDYQRRKIKELEEIIKDGEIASLNIQLTDKITECEELRNRLKEIESSRATGDISDRNDKNWKKLTERYRDLFDKEWTVAYGTVLEHKRTHSKAVAKGDVEKETIGTLLDVLKESSRFCQDEFRGDGTYLKSHQALADDQSMYHESTPSANTLYKKFRAQKKAINDIHISQIENYVKECLTLCWLMVNQDPHIVIELSAKPDDGLDKHKYREYMYPPIDFVILPPLLLLENGPVLSKGVAQGKQRCIPETKAPPKPKPKPKPKRESVYANESSVRTHPKTVFFQTDAKGQEIDAVDGATNANTILQQDIPTGQSRRDDEFDTRQNTRASGMRYKYDTVSSAYQAQQHQAKGSCVRQDDKSTDEGGCSSTDYDEYTRYLECLKMGYRENMIKNALGIDAYERCKAIEQQKESNA